MIKLQVTSLRYLLPIMILYGIVSLTGIFQHEIFLEEAQQLTIGRDSNSVIDVFNNMLYEGHVTLWNTFLFFIMHYISSRPIYMQLFHWLVINSTVFIFLRYAPFNLSVKTLIVFGCYFLFVYSIVSRNYALGILLLFICCILNHLTTQPLAFDGYNAGPPLSAYLGRKILYLDMDQYGSFCI